MAGALERSETALWAGQGSMTVALESLARSPLLAACRSKQPRKRQRHESPTGQAAGALACASCGASRRAHVLNDALSSLCCAANPKSVTLSGASSAAEVQRRFSGLRSRWMMPRWCT